MVLSDRDQKNFQWAAEILRKASGGTEDERTDSRNVGHESSKFRTGFSTAKNDLNPAILLLAGKMP